MAHQGLWLMVHLANWMSRTREMHNVHGPFGTVRLPRTWSSEWFRPGKGTKRPAHLGLCPCRTPENMSGLNLRSAKDAGATWDSALAEHAGAWAAWAPPWTLATPMWPSHWKHSPHIPAVFVSSDPFFPQNNWTSELNEVATFTPCVRVEIRQWRDLQTEEAKINKEGKATLGVTGATY